MFVFDRLVTVCFVVLTYLIELDLKGGEATK